MRKEVVVLFFSLFLVPFVSAGIDDGINEIVHYAEQYEVGKITYLQLVVHGGAITQKINNELGQEYSVEGDHSRRGLSEDDVKKLFGAPTDKTRWVWVMNEDREKRLDENLPTWEKRLFDGRKIVITLNAWPAMIEHNGEEILFYEVDFEIRFKSHYSFDLEGMLKEVTYKAMQFSESGQGGEELMDTAMEYERFLHGYLEQNSDDCKQVMTQFFDKEHKKEQQKIVRHRVVAFEGDNLLLDIVAEACESCEWPHVNMWFDIKPIGKDFEHPEEPDSAPEPKSFEDQSIDQLESQLESAVKGMVQFIKESDAAGRFGDMRRMTNYFST
ncbi:MAG: hypothetical protein ABIH34_00130, partial [Nanoarchaeota archaeon]